MVKITFKLFHLPLPKFWGKSLTPLPISGKGVGQRPGEERGRLRGIENISPPSSSTTTTSFLSPRPKLSPPHRRTLQRLVDIASVLSSLFPSHPLSAHARTHANGTDIGLHFSSDGMKGEGSGKGEEGEGKGRDFFNELILF